MLSTQLCNPFWIMGLLSFKLHTCSLLYTHIKIHIYNTYIHTHTHTHTHTPLWEKEDQHHINSKTAVIITQNDNSRQFYKPVYVHRCKWLNCDIETVYNITWKVTTHRQMEQSKMQHFKSKFYLQYFYSVNIHIKAGFKMLNHAVLKQSILLSICVALQ